MYTRRSGERPEVKNEEISCPSLPKAEAEKTKPVILRGVFSQADIDSLDRLYAAMKAESKSSTASGVSLIFPEDEMEQDWGECHEVIFMQLQERFDRELPELLQKLYAFLQEHDEWNQLSIPFVRRSVEYHVYRKDGELLDAGHCDSGSLLTISVLLNDPEEFSGGRFITWDGKNPIYHDSLQKGDGILFCSEKVHNVETVTSGVRRVFVMELWSGKKTVVDRWR